MQHDLTTHKNTTKMSREEFTKLQRLVSDNIGLTRLLQLSHHLFFGNAGHKVFDFRFYNSSPRNICGTAGCAIGELPIVFRGEWIYNDNGQPSYGYFKTPALGAMDFFSIPDSVYRLLFIPRKRSPYYQINGVSKLPPTATKIDVAKNIIAYIKFQIQKATTL